MNNEDRNYKERYKRICNSKTFKLIYKNKSIGDIILIDNCTTKTTNINKTKNDTGRIL